METIEESIFPEKTVTYATFWARFGAAFIDGIILYIPNAIIKYACMSAMGDKPGENIANLIGLIIGTIYFAAMESGANQATLGKKALGIKVTSVYGDRLTMGQAAGRYLGKIVSVLIIFIGFLMMLWDDKSQCLHDKMAGALVVKES